VLALRQGLEGGNGSWAGPQRAGLTPHYLVASGEAYIIAQVVDALAAAAALAAIGPSDPASLGATLPTVGIGSAFVYEVLLSAFLRSGSMPCSAVP